MAEKMVVSSMRNADVDFILWVKKYWNQLCPKAQKRVAALTFKASLKKFQPKR
jgi:hypothetical protein